MRYAGRMRSARSCSGCIHASLTLATEATHSMWRSCAAERRQRATSVVYESSLPHFAAAEAAASTHPYPRHRSPGQHVAGLRFAAQL
eukprot:366467-Chlamydomonas_euryale.AAC.6